VKIPKKIQVLTETYQVIFSSTLSENEGFLGKVYNGVITLDSSLLSDPKSLERVFYHEVAHAFMFEAGINDFVHRHALEMIAENMAAFIVQAKKNGLF